MRVYVSSRSYPELREVDAGPLARGIIWLRAFSSALRDPRFLGFLAVHLALILAGLAIARVIVESLSEGQWSIGTLVLVPVIIIGLQVPAMFLTVSVGGDVLRPHLRAVCPTAREACPSCGYGLREQFSAAEVETEAETKAGDATDGNHGHQDTDAAVRCPECGATVPLTVWRAPHRIPRSFRSVPWP